MSAADPAKKFASLLKKLRGRYDAPPADPCHDDRPEGAPAALWQLVFSILAFDASPARAAGVNKKLHAAVVDYNELRVCLADELMAIMGDRYPHAYERAMRLKSTLHDIYRRQHAVSLDHLPGLNKRDARVWLESLDGCPAYAAARVVLLELDGHAMPLDDRLSGALRAEQAIPADLSPEDAAGWVERQLRAGEAREVYLLLEAWASDPATVIAPPLAPASGSPSDVKPAAKADSKSETKAESKLDAKSEASGERRSKASGGRTSRKSGEAPEASRRGKKSTKG